jgi:hypothetical protein
MKTWQLKKTLKGHTNGVRLLLVNEKTNELILCFSVCRFLQPLLALLAKSEFIFKFNIL